MRANRLADLRRDLERCEHRLDGDSPREALHRSHLEHELCRELLAQAIADAEASHARLAQRLATVDRRAERTAYRLRAVRRYEPTPAPDVSRQRQRSAATISVAHATAS